MAIDKKTFALFRNIAKIVAPPPKLTVSEWADTYRKLSSEASAEPGQWRTDRSPYMREIMNALSDEHIERIVVMSSAQVGKTELLLNAIGYYVHQDPAPIMLVQPTLEMATAFSKDRLAPMTRDTPEIAKKMSDAKSRNSGNTMLHKTFAGGHITMAGANSPSSLASRPIRIVLADEVDRYPPSAGTEGDPVTLVTKRTTTFHNRKIVLVSTPTIKDASRIESSYNESTKEQWCVACPSCGHYQPYKWAQIKFEYDRVAKRCTEVYMACIECGAAHYEREWKANEGKWIAQATANKVRGFHLNEFASPWKSWNAIVEDFREANINGAEALKAWVNTSLGETWEEKGEQLDEDALYNRRELYHADVPDGVKILTAAVDTQDNRFEVEVQGWGAGYENWRIEYHVIYGDLKQPQVWNELDEYLKRTWTDIEGNQFNIQCTCIDSGGHFTNEVYRWAKPRTATRRIFPIKGESTGDGTYKPLIIGKSVNNRYKATVIRLGVDEGKAKVVSALRTPMVDETGEKMQGYVHFPLTTQDRNRGYERDYFDGLTAETLQQRMRLGKLYYVWVKTKPRNEPLDLAVYNRAAIELLSPDLDNMQPFCMPANKDIRVTTAVTAPRRQRRGSRGL
ncbi:phage terminase large subunit family protein [Paenibacillus camelliae]|uniref:phage terminase large subunit family protein n=1 Tax=Paenibacillus camelliae TaxID=512410 RepID=UPI0020407BAF|nr:phage terminase large subunit family protein [Paenibacillus camelliae]MCM3632945.1 phage terminase large subunit family protein [Paenibacillus camelliae]